MSLLGNLRDLLGDPPEGGWACPPPEPWQRPAGPEAPEAARAAIPLPPAPGADAVGP